jgi:hypothetical protein
MKEVQQRHSLVHIVAMHLYPSEVTRVCIEAAEAAQLRTGKRGQWKVQEWTTKVEPTRRQ